MMAINDISPCNSLWHVLGGHYRLRYVQESSEDTSGCSNDAVDILIETIDVIIVQVLDDKDLTMLLYHIIKWDNEY